MPPSQTEYFWKIKSQKDFDLPENFELPEGGAWKNYYFNQLSPEREFKQLIRAKDAQGAWKLALLQRENPDFDFNKMLLYVLEQRNLSVFKELITNLVGVISNLEVDKDIGLGVLCALSRMYGELFMYYLPTFLDYHDSEEDLVEVVFCAISGGDKDLIQRVYNFYLSIYGSGEGKSVVRGGPKRFVIHATRSLNKSKTKVDTIIDVIIKTFDSYERFRTRH